MSNYLGGPYRAAPKPPGRDIDDAFRAWVRTLPCAYRSWGGCRGATEANHVGNALGLGALGRKSDDRCCVPHCNFHHDQWTNHHGRFAKKTARHAWALEAVEITQAKYEAHVNGRDDIHY